jgi:energy-coupling factor transport system ATP-binding protein
MSKSANSDALIKVRNLHYTYLRGTPYEAVALRGVDLTVERGEIVGLIGPTGSGKSTLLQHLNGLLRPQVGEVWINGQNTSDRRTDLRAIRRLVGLVFQNPEDQLFERYAGDDVAFGPRSLGLSQSEVHQRVRWAMEAVGLDFEGFKDRLTMSLSEGERRRLALAGVLALKPEVLVLDEPTAGLDPKGRKALLAWLIRWREEQEGTIVLASHNMEDLAQLADRLYVLVEGRIVLNGTPRQVFSQFDVLDKYGLGTPLPVSVMHALRARGLPVRTDALTVTEAAAEIEALLSTYPRTAKRGRPSLRQRGRRRVAWVSG